MNVCGYLFEKDGKLLQDDASEILEKYITHLSEHRSQGFGNAREVRKIVNEVLKNQKLRLADIPKNERDDEMKKLITVPDVSEFMEVEVKYSKQIGYKN
jgi:hypothetical protein